MTSHESVRDLSARVTAAHKWEYHNPEQTDDWFYTIYNDGEVTYEARGWAYNGVCTYSPPIPGALQLGLKFAHDSVGNNGVQYSYSFVTREEALSFVKEIQSLVKMSLQEMSGHS